MSKITLGKCLLSYIACAVIFSYFLQTSRGEFDSSEFEVRRRYQDFLWLKERLEEAHPTLIIPPLPEKFIVKGMVERFNDDFIETRRKALHKFLNRIADHPTLTFNEDFKVFLTAQAWELSSHKKQGPGLLSRMGQTVRAVALSMRGVKSRPEEFMEMNNFIEIFSQKINLIDKISQRIYKEEREYFDEMKEYGPIHILWSASEEDLADTLKGVASCIDKCCKATEKRMSGLSEALLPGVMKRRDQIQAELDSKVEALTSKKADTDLHSINDTRISSKNRLYIEYQASISDVSTNLNTKLLVLTVTQKISQEMFAELVSVKILIYHRPSQQENAGHILHIPLTRIRKAHAHMPDVVITVTCRNANTILDNARDKENKDNQKAIQQEYNKLLKLTEEIGKLEDKVECANNALKADWERWKQNMQNDIKSAFTDMAEENIHYYEQGLQNEERTKEKMFTAIPLNSK
eukprot:bmy_15169T0